MTDSILVSADWQESLASMVQALAHEDFYQKLSAGCELLTGFESTLIVWLGDKHRPIHLYDDLPESIAAETKNAWFDGAYLLDPFYDLFLKKSPDGVYRLSELAPDSFFDSEYYHSYYLETGLTEEIGLLVNLNSENALFMSLGSRDQTKPREACMKNLQTVLPVLRQLCRRQQSAEEGEINFSAPLDKAFRNFGREHLSQRECEVIQLILKGHSNKAIAQLLEISPDTVKVYNKRFHAKLGISSQAELFSLFLESISLVPFDADVDPLTHYMEITRPL